MKLNFMGSEFKKLHGAKIILNGRNQIKLGGVRGNKGLKL
jgi:hypothetical protein